MKRYVVALLVPFVVACNGAIAETDIDALFLPEGMTRTSYDNLRKAQNQPPNLPYTDMCWPITDKSIDVTMCTDAGQSYVECDQFVDRVKERCDHTMWIDRNGDGYLDMDLKEDNVLCCHEDGY